MFRTRRLLPVEPHSPGLRDQIWWCGTPPLPGDRRAGPQPDESTLPTRTPAYRSTSRRLSRSSGSAKPWKAGGNDREPRAFCQAGASSRSSAKLFESAALPGDESTDQVWLLDGGAVSFRKMDAGKLDKFVAELAEDEAIAAAGHLLLTVPNQLGVDDNVHLSDSVIAELHLSWSGPTPSRRLRPGIPALPC